LRMSKEASESAADIFEGFVVENLDLQRGQKSFTPEVYADVLRAWCKHAPAGLEQLRALAGEISDAVKLREYVIAAHGFKGSCCGICADDIGKLAEALEHAGREGNLAFIEENNASLIEKASALHSALAEFFAARTADKGAKSKASSPDPALLAEVLTACKQFKSSVMEDALQKLESFEYESGGDLVSWLRDQIDNLEYDAIQERLGEMLGT